MATRALAAAAIAGRRAASQGGLAAVLSSSASCSRRGGGKAQSFSHSTAEREREGHTDADATAAQVEAALNRKNVDVVEGDHSATLLAADAAQALRGVGDGDVAGADDAWVPDQETGVFVPADEASGDGTGNGNGHTQVSAAPSSVLDQTVFVRDEDMEDVERPAVGGTDAK